MASSFIRFYNKSGGCTKWPSKKSKKREKTPFPSSTFVSVAMEWDDGISHSHSAHGRKLRFFCFLVNEEKKKKKRLLLELYFENLQHNISDTAWSCRMVLGLQYGMLTLRRRHDASSSLHSQEHCSNVFGSTFSTVSESGTPSRNANFNLWFCFQFGMLWMPGLFAVGRTLPCVLGITFSSRHEGWEAGLHYIRLITERTVWRIVCLGFRNK